jgi:hypothetical protein
MLNATQEEANTAEQPLQKIARRNPARGWQGFNVVRTEYEQLE